MKKTRKNFPSNHQVLSTVIARFSIIAVVLLISSCKTLDAGKIVESIKSSTDEVIESITGNGDSQKESKTSTQTPISGSSYTFESVKEKAWQIGYKDEYIQVGDSVAIHRGQPSLGEKAFSIQSIRNFVDENVGSADMNSMFQGVCQGTLFVKSLLNVATISKYGDVVHAINGDQYYAKFQAKKTTNNLPPQVLEALGDMQKALINQCPDVRTIRIQLQYSSSTKANDTSGSFAIYNGKMKITDDWVLSDNMRQGEIQNVDQSLSRWKDHYLVYRNDVIEIYSTSDPTQGESGFDAFAAIHKIGKDDEIYPVLSSDDTKAEFLRYKADEKAIWNQFRNWVLEHVSLRVASGLVGKINFFHYVESDDFVFPKRMGQGNVVTSYRLYRPAVDSPLTNKWSWRIESPTDGINTYNKKFK